MYNIYICILLLCFFYTSGIHPSKKKEETPPAARDGWCRPGAGGPPETLHGI